MSFPGLVSPEDRPKGDPFVFGQMSQQYQGAAAQFDEAARSMKLAAAELGASYQGAAATNADARLTELGEALALTGDGYRQAAAALSVFAGRLSQAQAEFDAAMWQVAQSDGALDELAAMGARNRAQGAIDEAERAAFEADLALRELLGTTGILPRLQPLLDSSINNYDAATLGAVGVAEGLDNRQKYKPNRRSGNPAVRAKWAKFAKQTEDFHRAHPDLHKVAEWGRRLDADSLSRFLVGLDGINTGIGRYNKNLADGQSKASAVAAGVFQGGIATGADLASGAFGEALGVQAGIRIGAMAGMWGGPVGFIAGACIGGLVGYAGSRVADSVLDWGADKLYGT